MDKDYSFASYCTSWGFDDQQEFKPRNEEYGEEDDVYGVRQKEVVTSFRFNATSSRSLINIYNKLVKLEQSNTSFAIIKLIGDHDDHVFHTACLYILNISACFYVGTSIIIFENEVDIITKIIKDLDVHLSLQFELGSMEDVVGRIDYIAAFRYLIFVNIIHHFHQNNYRSYILPNDNVYRERQIIGTLGKCYVQYYINMATLTNITFSVHDSDGVAQYIAVNCNFEVCVSKYSCNLHSTESDVKITQNPTQCMYSGEEFGNYYPHKSFSESLPINQHLKTHGYNDYIPQTMDQLQTYWKTRFNVDVDNHVDELIVVESIIGNMIVPKKTIATSYTSIDARTRRYANTINKEFMEVMKTCSAIFDTSHVPSTAFNNNRKVENISFLNGNEFLKSRSSNSNSDNSNKKEKLASENNVEERNRRRKKRLHQE